MACHGLYRTKILLIQIKQNIHSATHLINSLQTGLNLATTTPQTIVNVYVYINHIKNTAVIYLYPLINRLRKLTEFK